MPFPTEMIIPAELNAYRFFPTKYLIFRRARILVQYLNEALAIPGQQLLFLRTRCPNKNIVFPLVAKLVSLGTELIPIYI